jgi:hypothetical protein
VQPHYTAESIRPSVGSPIRVRTATSPAWIYGTLQSVDNTTFNLTNDRRLERLRLAEAAAIQRNNGRESLVFGLAGALAGAFAGGVVGWLVADHHVAHSQDVSIARAARPIRAAEYGGVGAVLGLGLGVALAPTSWIPVEAR